MKDYREKEMLYLLGVYIFAFIILCTPLFRNSTDYSTGEINVILTILQSTLFSGMLSLATFLCDSLIDSRIKDLIIGLYFIPKSGETIFTRIKKNKVKDDRFLITDAKNRYKQIIDSLPSQCVEKRNKENAEWYKIYRRHKDDMSVCQTQRDYLICRDLCSESVVFLALYLCFAFLFKEIISVSTEFLALLLSVMVITILASHVKMNRFVNTVIAVDISEEEQE